MRMLDIQQAHHSLMLSGLLDSEDLPQLKAALASLQTTETLHLVMHDLDIEEGKAMAGITAMLKNLLARQVYVRLDGPPQLVVHNLYRVGYHPHACLQVDGMREDEAYG